MPACSDSFDNHLQVPGISAQEEQHSPPPAMSQKPVHVGSLDDIVHKKSLSLSEGSKKSSCGSDCPPMHEVAEEDEEEVLTYYQNGDNVTPLRSRRASTGPLERAASERLNVAWRHPSQATAMMGDMNKSMSIRSDITGTKKSSTETQYNSPEEFDSNNHVISTDLKEIFYLSPRGDKKKDSRISSSKHQYLIDSHTSYRRDLDKNITDLKLKLALVQEVADICKHELTSVKKELASAQSQLQQRDVQIEELNKKYKETAKKADSLSMVLTHMQDNAKDSALERNALQTSTVEKEKENTRLLSKTKQLKNENRKLKRALQDIQKEVDGKAMEIQGLKSENEYIRRQQHLDKKKNGANRTNAAGDGGQKKHDMLEQSNGDIDSSDCDSNVLHQQMPQVFSGFRDFLTPYRPRRRRRTSDSNTEPRKASMSSITDTDHYEKDINNPPRRQKIELPEDTFERHAHKGGSYKAFADILMEDSSVATGDCEEQKISSGGGSKGRRRSRHRSSPTSQHLLHNILAPQHQHQHQSEHLLNLPAYSSEQALSFRNAEIRSSSEIRNDIDVHGGNRSDESVETPPPRIDTTFIDHGVVQPTRGPTTTATEIDKNQSSPSNKGAQKEWWWNRMFTTDENPPVVKESYSHGLDDDFDSHSILDADGATDSDGVSPMKMDTLYSTMPPPSSENPASPFGSTLVPKRLGSSML